MESGKKNNKKRRITSKQVVALAGVVLLVLLYVITLVVAIVDHSESANWFRISLFGTLAIPLIIWIYAWMYARLTGKKTIGDPDSPDFHAEKEADLQIPDTDSSDNDSM